MFNSFRNIVERFRWNFSILYILLIFQNVASATPKNVTAIFKQTNFIDTTVNFFKKFMIIL